MTGLYDYEKIEDERGVSFRVRDSADNRVATCYLEQNAFMIAEALNYRVGVPVHWTCGHIAKGCCAECHQQLTVKLTELTEKYQLALDALADAGIGGIY